MADALALVVHAGPRGARLAKGQGAMGSTSESFKRGVSEIVLSAPPTPQRDRRFSAPELPTLRVDPPLPDRVDLRIDLPPLQCDLRGMPGRKLAETKHPQFFRNRARTDATTRRPQTVHPLAEADRRRRPEDEGEDQSTPAASPARARSEPFVLMAIYESGEHEIFEVQTKSNATLNRVHAQNSVSGRDVSELLQMLSRKGVQGLVDVEVVGYARAGAAQQRVRKLREASISKAVVRMRGAHDMAWLGVGNHKSEVRRAQDALRFKLDHAQSRTLH
mmetsp:Transcript_5841/g.18580  ORF Transcript_5841/g.18580 Transcript_5841/m.18580 type:complete len:276 (-) Transcript_5841:115-942(-)